MLSPEHWLQNVVTVVAAVVFIGGIVYLGVPSNLKTPDKMFFGQQFHESDLKGTTGKLMKLAVACDLTSTIVPDLLADGFVPQETSHTVDLEKKPHVITFWKRETVDGFLRIVTETDSESLTCIISVSKTIEKTEQPSTPSGNDGETRDTLDGFVPV
jgi:hypothetical protein